MGSPGEGSSTAPRGRRARPPSQVPESGTSACPPRMPPFPAPRVVTGHRPTGTGTGGQAPAPAAPRPHPPEFASRRLRPGGPNLTESTRLAGGEEGGLLTSTAAAAPPASEALEPHWHQPGGAGSPPRGPVPAGASPAAAAFLRPSHPSPLPDSAAREHAPRHPLRRRRACARADSRPPLPEVGGSSPGAAGIAPRVWGGNCCSVRPSVSLPVKSEPQTLCQLFICNNTEAVFTFCLRVQCCFFTLRRQGGSSGLAAATTTSPILNEIGEARRNTNHRSSCCQYKVYHKQLIFHLCYARSGSRMPARPRRRFAEQVLVLAMTLPCLELIWM